MYKLTTMKAIIPVILTLFVSGISAQTPATRIGYADVEYIMAKMPELRAVESELKVVEDQLAKRIDAKTTELKAKYAEYVAQEKDMLPALKNNAQREIQILQQNLEQLKADAQASYEKKYLALMQPLYEKIGKAIESVGRENGYTLILNTAASGNALILFGEEGNNVSDLVLEKMGITATASRQTPD